MTLTSALLVGLNIECVSGENIDIFFLARGVATDLF